MGRNVNLMHCLTIVVFVGLVGTSVRAAAFPPEGIDRLAHPEVDPLMDNPIFYSREDVERDAHLRLKVNRDITAKAQSPSGSNTVTYEGTVHQIYTSTGDYGAFLVGPDDARFECDNQATILGCRALMFEDHVLVYGHLRTYVSVRHDGTDDEVVANLIYRRILATHGDLTYYTWEPLTH